VLFGNLREVLDPEPHAAALNMAIDEALLAGATEPLLRIYRWSTPTVSFGYFGKHEEIAAAWPRRELVRRWTGGGVVPHGDDVTYSLLVPAGYPIAKQGPLESYQVIHEALARWFAAKGIGASLTAGAPKVSEECFANPAPHDVLAGGHKIAGAAQRRTRLGLLHQGSIQHVPGIDRWRDSLSAAFSAQVQARPIAAEEIEAAKLLVESKYGREDWLRRW
jgi:lipoyl(octanoyl) transferase